MSQLYHVLIVLPCNPYIIINVENLTATLFFLLVKKEIAEKTCMLTEVSNLFLLKGYYILVSRLSLHMPQHRDHENRMTTHLAD